jgi:hypothetical protein
VNSQIGLIKKVEQIVYKADCPDVESLVIVKEVILTVTTATTKLANEKPLHGARCSDFVRGRNGLAKNSC